MRATTANLKREVLMTFTGDPDGNPEWAQRLAEGEDTGFFPVGSDPWVIHSSFPTLVAGIRALLVQALHPGALAGVHDWSRFREDPLGRLAGTIRWLATVTFADTERAEAECARVRRLHDRVSGMYVTGSGATVEYSAHDDDLATWVHTVFADSFLTTHLALQGGIDDGGDRYVREWAPVGTLLGVSTPPRSVAELRRDIDNFRTSGALRVDDRTRDVVAFVRRPPLHPTLMPAYGVLFAAAVATIPVELRRMLGLRRTPLPILTTARVTLWALRLVIGTTSPAELHALSRHERLGAN